MQPTRYTTEELIPILTNIFYDYMIEKNEEGKTGVKEVRDLYDSKVSEYKERIEICSEKLQSSSIEKDCEKSLTEQLDYLQKGLFFYENSNRDFQFKLYQKTKVTDFCRSGVRISLNKKINSFYDDLYLDVMFYDDVCTPKGKRNLYDLCKTKEEKLEFLIKNIKKKLFLINFIGAGMHLLEKSITIICYMEAISALGFFYF